jgi:hypothetical protein
MQPARISGTRERCAERVFDYMCRNPSEINHVRGVSALAKVFLSRNCRHMAASVAGFCTIAPGPVQKLL